MKIHKTIAIFVLVSLVMLGAGFITGTKYQNRKQLKMFQGTRLENGNIPDGQKGRMGNQNGFKGGTSGEIISKDDKSITVKMQDGSSKIILFTDSTQINIASQGTKDNLKIGEKVSVFGAANTDGSVTATNIQLNPIAPNTP
jgi:hypothetical protein